MKELFEQIWNMPAQDLAEVLEILLLKVLRGFGWALVTFLVIGSLCYTAYNTYPLFRRLWAGYDARKKREKAIGEGEAEKRK